MRRRVGKGKRVQCERRRSTLHVLREHTCSFAVASSHDLPDSEVGFLSTQPSASSSDRLIDCRKMQ